MGEFIDLKITIQYQVWKTQFYTFISTPKNLFLSQVLLNQCQNVMGVKLIA